MDKETKIKLEKLQAEKNNGFNSYLNYITQHFGKEGMISYDKAEKYFYYQKIESDSLENLLLEIKYEIYNHIIFIKLNNPAESIASILAIIFSKYYGNKTKYINYLLSLSFPKSVREFYIKEKNINRYIGSDSLLFIDTALKISRYWPLFLSGNEYKYFVIYEAIRNYITFENTKFLMTYQFSNLYDFEILQKAEKDLKIINSETNYGSQIFEYIHKRKEIENAIDEYREKQKYYNWVQYQPFIDECKNKIEILTKTYFEKLNLYNGYRID